MPRTPIPYDPRTTGQGLIEHIAAFQMDDGSRVVEMSGWIGPKLGARAGLEDTIPTRAGFHNAHLWPQTWGDEAAAGVSHAIPDFNQSAMQRLQNSVANFASSVAPGNRAYVEATLVTRTDDPTVLDHIVYRVTERTAAGTEVSGFGVVVDGYGKVDLAGVSNIGAFDLAATFGLTTPEALGGFLLAGGKIPVIGLLSGLATMAEIANRFLPDKDPTPGDGGAPVGGPPNQPKDSEGGAPQTQAQAGDARPPEGKDQPETKDGGPPEGKDQPQTKDAGPPQSKDGDAGAPDPREPDPPSTGGDAGPTGPPQAGPLPSDGGLNPGGTSPGKAQETPDGGAPQAKDGDAGAPDPRKPDPPKAEGDAAPAPPKPDAAKIDGDAGAPDLPQSRGRPGPPAGDGGLDPGGTSQGTSETNGNAQAALTNWDTALAPQDIPAPVETHDDILPPVETHDDIPPPVEMHDDIPPPAEMHDNIPPPVETHDDIPPPEAHQDQIPPADLHNQDQMPPVDVHHQDQMPPAEAHQDQTPADIPEEFQGAPS